MKEIIKYFTDLSDEQYAQFSAIESIYREWNEQINVVSRKDIDAIYLHHVLHSLSIAKWLDFKAGTSVFDLGCGGGFPGIPLAILFPETTFHLLDARAKKIKVVQAVVDTLALDNVTASHGRAEEHKTQYDFVISRAVAPLDKLWSWSRPLIRGNGFNERPNGLITLKGGDLHEEMSQVPVNVEMQMVSLSHFFEEDYFETKKLLHLHPKKKK